MKNSNCIIITQKEWLNWLAFGYLRVSPSRISYFDNTESSFDILMSYSVDNALDEEDAYLLASLVDDYSRDELHVKRTSLSDYILVQAVQGFYTLSAKGADLLEYEAGQSHSILHYDSKIEDLWNEWKNTQFKLRSHDKGNKFLEILGYPKFKSIPELKTNTLLHKELESYGHAPLSPIIQGYSKMCAFTWFYTSAKFSQIIGREKYSQYKMWREISKNEELRALNDLYNEQTSSKDKFKYLAIDNAPLVNNLSFIAEKIFFDSICKSEDNFLAISFLVHYYNLLDNNLEINLYFLKTDLTFLDEIYSTKYISQLIAYFIGRRLNEVYLNFLYIAKNIDEKKSGMFDTNFFSNLKNEKLTLCNVDEVQLQEIIRKVNAIAKEIKLAYNMEVNNVQEPEIASDTIADSDLNQPTQSQAPTTDSDNSETNNNPIENLDTPSNTTDNNSSQTHLEDKNSLESEESEDTTNKTGDSNQPMQSQPTIVDNSNIETNNILSKEKEYIPSNITNDNPTPPHPGTQYSVDSKYSGDSTNRIDDSDQPIHSQPPMTNNSNNENNSILPDKNVDIPSSETSNSSVEANSEAKNLVESEDSEYITSKITTKNKVFNEHNENPKLSSHTQPTLSHKEAPIDSSDKIETITESVIGSKSDDKNLDKPDSEYFKDLALNIYSELSSEEKKIASPFIKKFNEHVSDSEKNKLRSRPHKDFFRDFGELIGDIKTYQDISYDDFKSILDRRFKPVAEEQVELDL